jgi:hypothetical protein
MFLIALTLLLRTYADVWMIQTSTGIEAAIIARKRSLFWTLEFLLFLLTLTCKFQFNISLFNVHALGLRR